MRVFQYLCVVIIASMIVPIEANAAQAPRTMRDHGSSAEGRPQIAAAIIRDLYARLAKYSRGTEGELRFKLDNFRTLTGERARQARLLDLFTPAEGRLVDVHIEHAAQGEDVRAGYHARWSSEEAPRWDYTAEGRAHQNATVEDIIREASVDSPELAEISAVTSYRVTVHLAGKSRTYRAAAFWIQLPEELSRPLVVDAKYVIQDHITVGLSEVAEEAALALSDPPRKPVRAAVPDPDLRKTVCQVTSHTLPLETVTSTSSASYRPKFQGNITCSCDSACYSGCVPTVTQASCGRGSCRKTSTDLVTKTAYAYALGAAKGAECAAGWACAGIKCSKILFWCSCGSVSVKVSISTKIGLVTPSLEVGYTISPSNAYSRKVDGVAVCPPCFAAGSPNPGISPSLYSGGSNTIVNDIACGDLICDSELGETSSTCPLDCDCSGMCREARQECMTYECPGMLMCDTCEMEEEYCLNSCLYQ